MKKIITLPKIDYNNTGKKTNAVSIELSLEDGYFSASASIWNNIRTDIIAGGQILEELLKFYPDNKLVKKIVNIWRKYHLNDLTPGSPKQMSYLKSVKNKSYGDFYTWQRTKLKEIDLLIDKSFLHNGKPYEYGTAWLSTEIPENIKKEIFSIMN